MNKALTRFLTLIMCMHAERDINKQLSTKEGDSPQSQFHTSPNHDGWFIYLETQAQAAQQKSSLDILAPRLFVGEF